MSYLRIPVYPLTEHSYLPFDPDDLPERFKAMKGQETNAYKVEDYLNPYYAYEAPELITSDVESDAESDAESATSLPNCSAAGINNDWRSKICEWLFQVVDYFNYDREIVAVSMNYLDRYLCKRPVNKRTFQLLAMTSLYMASKLHRQYNSIRLRMSSLIEMGREYFTEEHVTAMEKSILDELGWQLRPPTPLAFVKTYVLLLNPSVCKPTVRQYVMEVAKFLTELAVIDYHYTPLKPSSIGLAALFTAMEGVPEEQLAMEDKRDFATNVYHVAQVSPNDPEVMDCRTRLRTTYYEGGIYEQQQQEAEAATAAQANCGRMYAATCVDASLGRPCSCHLRGDGHDRKSSEEHGFH